MNTERRGDYSASPRAQKSIALVVILFCLAYIGRQIVSQSADGVDLYPKTEITECHFLLRNSHVDSPSSLTLILGAAEGLREHLPTSLQKKGGLREHFPDDLDQEEALGRLETLVSDISGRSELKIGREELTYKALAGMVGSISDPYSRAMNPRAYAEFKAALQSQPFGGVGLQLGREGSDIVVFAVLPDTPAFQASIQPGDILVAIEGNSVEKKTIEEVEQLLQGEVGTDVYCRFRRNQTTFDRTLKRVQLKTRSVRARVVVTESGLTVGWMSIDVMQDTTAQELQEEITKLASVKPAGIVIDLRDNVGGYVRTALEVASLFLDSGKTVLTIRDRKESEDRQTVGSHICSLPLVVLVNKRTASSAEIVAACLQDYARAKVVGEKTFGKGSVQSLHEFESGGGLKFTTARYTTPNGRVLDGNGLLPDKALSEPEVLNYCDQQWVKESPAHGQ